MIGVRSYETRAAPMHAGGRTVTLVERTSILRLGRRDKALVALAYRRPLAVEVAGAVEHRVAIRDHVFLSRIAAVVMFTMVYITRRFRDDRSTA